MAVIAATLLLALSPFAQANKAPADTKTEDRPVATIEDVLVKIRELDRQLSDISRRLESISNFLGDKQASGFPTVDRRLEELQKDINELRRDVQRLR